MIVIHLAIDEKIGNGDSWFVFIRNGDTLLMGMSYSGFSFINTWNVEVTGISRDLDGLFCMTSSRPKGYTKSCSMKHDAVVSTVAADDLAPSGARSSAGTVMIHVGFRVNTGQVLQGLWYWVYAACRGLPYKQDTLQRHVLRLPYMNINFTARQ